MLSRYIVLENSSFCDLPLLGVFHLENYPKNQCLGGPSLGAFTAGPAHGLAQGAARKGRTRDVSRMADGDGADLDGFDINDTPEKRALKARLVELREEHRALDSAIMALQTQNGGDALQLARLKKRKLVLRDQIQWIEDRLTPDIIA